MKKSKSLFQICGGIFIITALMIYACTQSNNSKEQPAATEQRAQQESLQMLAVLPSGGPSTIVSYSPDGKDTLITYISYYDTTVTTFYTYQKTKVDTVWHRAGQTQPTNLAPIVSAGSTQTITLPTNSVTLTGTASDPDGTIATTLWAKVSGTGGSIVDPGKLSTTVTGLTAGSYMFRFTATDDKGTSSIANVNVIVNAEIVLSSTYGFGSAVTGGDAYKSTPIHVTTLNPTGPGSLTEAIKSNRYIVFDLGGTIKNFRFDVGNNISGTFQNLTIDGSTAPSPGITLDNGTAGGNTLGFENANKNIIIKYIRAINAQNGDNFHFLGIDGLIVDHCAAWGAGDGNIDLTDGSKNVTISYSIFGPGCNCNANGTDNWAGNSLVAYGSGRITMHHNFFYSRTPGGVAERNPDVSNQSGTVPSPVAVDFVQNIVVNWGREDGTGSGYGTSFNYGSFGNVVSNYYYTDKFPPKFPNATPDKAVSESAYGETKGTIYADGNVSGNSSKVNGFSKTTPYVIPAQNAVPNETACQALTKALAAAGVRYAGVSLSSQEQTIISIIVASHPGCQ